MLSQVIYLVGWKRMECNRLIQFDGVTESIFHSIFRQHSPEWWMSRRDRFVVVSTGCICDNTESQHDSS